MDRSKQDMFPTRKSRRAKRRAPFTGTFYHLRADAAGTSTRSPPRSSNPAPMRAYRGTFCNAAKLLRS